MIVSILALVAWTSLENQKWERGIITYSVEDDFCDNILRHFLEDRFLSFHSINCDDIKWTLRRAFSAWEYNSDRIKFKEVADTEVQNVDIRITHQDVGEQNVIATASNFKSSGGHRIDSSVILVDDSFCFYIDNVFCHRMNQFEEEHDWLLPFLKALLLASCIVYSGILIILQVQGTCYHRTSRHRVMLTLGTAWGMLLPLVLWGVVVPCTNCHDFNVVMTHEIGHSLGFGHTDGDYNQCGCTNVTPCGPDETSILVSKVDKRPNACLSQSDADGFHRKYNESCRPVVCFPSASESYIGYARGAVSILVPILASLSASALIHCTERRRALSVDTPPSALPSAPRARVGP